MRSIQHCLWILGLFVAGSHANEKPQTTAIEGDFEKSETKVTRTLVDHDYTDFPKTITFSCHLFTSYAVVFINHVGIKNGDVWIRSRKNITPEEQMCAFNFSGKIVRLQSPEGDFWGLIGDYVFLNGPEKTGYFTPFSVYDVHTGKRMFQGTVHTMEEYSVIRQNQKIGFAFSRGLDKLEKGRCVPGPEAESCWRKILELNGVHPNSPIEPPNCEPAITRLSKRARNNGLQFAVKAMIDDLARPVLSYPKGTASCDVI